MNNYALGIDTSNYATSLAVMDAGTKEVVCALKRFLPVQEGQLGLRQSDAVFHHVKALPELFLELESKVPLHRVASVGVSVKPRDIEKSYMPCFLAGLAAAQAFAAGRGLPLCQTSHQQGHLAAGLLGAGLPTGSGQKVLFFHLSGGTTELLLAQGTRVLEKMGESCDLFAGQAIDRLGVLLGHAFPAGAAVSALAEQCDAALNPKISVNGMDCHFSGLQNQCEAMLKAGKSEAEVCRFCLLAVAKTVVAMASAARKKHPGLPLVCAGGVMCSTVIRAYVCSALQEVYVVAPELSADNAVGIALIAAQHGSREANNG